jgi:hypothetical protein
MDPIDDALLAVLATIAGDTTDAHRHLDAARQHSRSAARRHRQIVEIATLVIGECRERAEGLAQIHTAEFPQDAELLARITQQPPQREVQRRRLDV